MDDEISMPCAHALLAGTMALMTAFANPTRDAKVDQSAQRLLLARKVVSNLFFLREHPEIPAGLRQVATTMHRHWSTLAKQLECRPEESFGETRVLSSGEDIPGARVLH